MKNEYTAKLNDIAQQGRKGFGWEERKKIVIANAALGMKQSCIGTLSKNKYKIASSWSLLAMTRFLFFQDIGQEIFETRGCLG